MLMIFDYRRGLAGVGSGEGSNVGIPGFQGVEVEGWVMGNGNYDYKNDKFMNS